MKVVFSVGQGEGSNGSPPLYFRKKESNIDKVLYDCKTNCLRQVKAKKLIILFFMYWGH